MDFRPLPRSDLWVSAFSLGTMTFGEQTQQEDAFAQLDMAREAGVNLIDSAEMYPVPPRRTTQGESERILGRWLRDRACRDDVILATKVTAKDRGMQHIREGKLRLSAENIARAVDESLGRLGTDRIDLYQIHWPERETTNFGRRDYAHAAVDEESTPLVETLRALAAIQEEGKIRYVGLSNETPWGAMTCLRLAKKHHWPSVVSVQNPYNLLSRTFDEGLAEIAHREALPLLAYSPLAFGKLTGKYLHGRRPLGSRLACFPRFSRYEKPAAEQAVQAYDKLARGAGLTVRELSLAFVRQRPGVASVLLGATTAAQLKENLACAELRLPEDLLCRVDKIHSRYPNPCP